MVLSGGKFHLALTERQMSILLDALDISITTQHAISASGHDIPVTQFALGDFDEVRALLQRRFNY